MKKYELTPETIVHNGSTLHRIKALRDIGNIKAGELGGYIEHENNLSQEGYCWVYDQAKVYNQAVVSDDAIVADNAEVYDYAKVFGTAIVYENAKVYGTSWVLDNARVVGNAEVFGEAEVSDSSWVLGDAKVYGNSHISGNVKVLKNAKVFGEAYLVGNAEILENAEINTDTQVFSADRVGFENTTFTVYAGKNGIVVSVGRTAYTVEEFLEKSKKTWDETTYHEHKLLIEVAKSRIQKPFDLRS